MTSPLIEVGMSFTVDVAPLLDPSVLSIIRKSISDFVEGKVEYIDTVRIFTQLVGSSNPIDKLHEILMLPDDPIPDINLDTKDDNSRRRKTRTWTSQEDMRLLAGVHKYGLDSWSNVCHFVGNGRTRAQCSQRWLRVLDPKISKEQWSPQESAELLRLVAEYGEKKWMKIATELGNRSDVQCRYHYIQLQREDKAKRNRELQETQSTSDVPPRSDSLELSPIQETNEEFKTDEPIPEEDAPISLTAGLEGGKSESLFDSNVWLLPPNGNNSH